MDGSRDYLGPAMVRKRPRTAAKAGAAVVPSSSVFFEIGDRVLAQGIMERCWLPGRVIGVASVGKDIYDVR